MEEEQWEWLLPQEELLEESNELGECLQLQRQVPSFQCLLHQRTLAE